MPAERPLTIPQVMELCRESPLPRRMPAPKPALRIYVPPRAKPARKRRRKS